MHIGTCICCLQGLCGAGTKVGVLRRFINEVLLLQLTSRVLFLQCENFLLFRPYLLVQDIRGLSDPAHSLDLALGNSAVGFGLLLELHPQLILLPQILGLHHSYLHLISLGLHLQVGAEFHLCILHLSQFQERGIRHNDTI